MLTLYAGNFFPEIAKGIVRDLRVRWALAEAEIPYQTKLVSRDDMTMPAYRAIQPFGQLPAIQDGDLRLFESTAIMLHIGSRSEELLPRDHDARMRVIAWMMAASNTIELPIGRLCQCDLFPALPEAELALRPHFESAIRKRLDALESWLDGKKYLEGQFTAGDLVMSSSLTMMKHTDILASVPALDAYVKRCQDRPAFHRAMADHLSTF